MCLYFLGKYFLLPLERKELTDHGVTAPNPGQHYSIAPRPSWHTFMVGSIGNRILHLVKERVAGKESGKTIL